MRSAFFTLFATCGLLAMPSAATAGYAASGSFTAADVRFANGGVELAATILTPGGPGPFPGVVIVQGSGGSSRANPWTTAYAKALASAGIVVLHPDKRGSGESGGDWRTAGFDALARDALAALALLRARPEVDPERVGLAGFSQGGDVAPLAASRSSDVRFVIDVSGSVVPLSEQIGDEIRLAARAAGISDDGQATLARIHALGWRFSQTDEGWEDYEAALAAARKGELAGSEVLGGFPTDREAAAWGFLHTVGDFDPLPYWRGLQVPVLFLYGARDRNVDVVRSARIILDELVPQRSGVTLQVFSGNGHAHFRADAVAFLARWIADGGAD